VKEFGNRLCLERKPETGTYGTWKQYPEYIQYMAKCQIIKLSDYLGKISGWISYLVHPYQYAVC
jgi:hypothetical protein